MIPYGRQDISDQDVDAVTSVLRAPFLTQGPKVPEFEEAIASQCDARFGVAFSSATSALHGACRALGLDDNQTLWTSAISFVASSNAGLYCGAKVDFVDIEAETFNMSVSALKDKLVAARKSDSLPDIVMPVHMCGQSCDMEEIADLAESFGFEVIEDASHAVGGGYKGLPVGNCKYSSIAVFSFHPVKIITSAEGGMAMTRSGRLADRLRRFRTHGITRDASEMVGEPDGPWDYQQIDLGLNYRITDVQAALGTSQAGRLAEFVERRAKLATRYDALLADLALDLPLRKTDRLSANHLYVVRAKQSTERHRMFEELRAAGIGVNVHYKPIYLQPYYQALGFKQGLCPVAEDYYARAITIPLFATMTLEQQNQVVYELGRVCA